MVETRSKTKNLTPTSLLTRRMTEKQLRNLVKRFTQSKGVTVAFSKLFDHPEDGDDYALKMLTGFNAASHGEDSTSSPPYQPPEGLSPMASWRGGPRGDATVYELATGVLDDPDNLRARILFEEALQSQHANILRLYYDQDLYKDGEVNGLETAKRLLSEQPLEVRNRLLVVYDRLATAMNILRVRGSGVNHFAFHPPPAHEEKETSDLPPALQVFLKELISTHISSAFEPFHHERVAVQEQLEELRDESQAVRQDQARAGRASAEGIESVMQRLESLNQNLEELKKEGSSGMDEKFRRVKDEMEAIKTSAAVKATPTSRTSLFGSMAGSVSKLDARKELDLPDDMPGAREWMLLPPPVGLEKSQPADYASAWISRPVEGDAGKASRKQLGITLTQDKLLEGLPGIGETIAYGLLRSRMLENWFLFAEYIHGGGDRGESSLHRALVYCATRLHNDKSRQESQWRSLINAGSVANFLMMLDGIYCDRSHTAAEEEWAAAKSQAKDALDYLRRMRHLLTNDEARSRGRHNLNTYLAERRDDLALSQLATCSDDVDAWHNILDSLHSVRKQISSNSTDNQPTSIKGKGANVGGVLGMSIDRSTSKKQNEHYEGGSVQFDVDINLKEAGAVIAKLLEMQKEQQNNLNRAIMVMDANGSASSSSAETGSHYVASFGRLDQFRPDVQGGPPKVYDLPRIYKYLELSSPIPDRRGPHSNGTHGEECAICSEFFKIKKFMDHEVLKQLGFPEDSRAYHQAFKCSKIPKAVEIFAAKSGQQEKVAELCLPIPDPHWKPKGS